MKNLSTIFFSLFLTLTFSVNLFAQTENPDSAINRINELDEMTFVQILNSVDLGEGEEVALIREFQAKEGKRLGAEPRFGNIAPDPKRRENKIKIEAYRNKEVLVVTIPADSLFAPNSTELLPSAGRLLDVFTTHLKTPDQYRVLLAMHTDNTGSEEYRDLLTQDRVDAVFDWFDDHGCDTKFLFPYAFGDDMPSIERITVTENHKKVDKMETVENNSVFNRAKNRRLEIYLVPGETMLQMAKNKRIVLRK